MSEIELWIDQRERHVIPYFDSIDYKKIPPYKLELRTLSAGDYAVVYKDHIIMLIERKSWQDLAATFLDRSRKFNYEKMISERNQFGCFLFYLVEGKRPAVGINHVQIETLEAHLDHLYFDHQIVTLYSESVEKTPERIFRLIKHYITSHSNPFKALEEKLGGSQTIVESKDLDCIPSTKLSASNNLKTAKKMSDDAIKYAMWNCIEGMTEPNYLALNDIGINLGGLLLNQYKPENLIHAKYKLGTLVGLKKITKIINSASQLATHIKVMSQIPSISETRAKIILDKFALSDIITGSVTEQMIADINIVSQTQNNLDKEVIFGDEVIFEDPQAPSDFILPNVSNKVSLLLGLGDTNGRRLGISAARNVIKYLSIKNK